MKKQLVFIILFTISMVINCKGAKTVHSYNNKSIEIDSLLLKKAYDIAQNIVIVDCHSHSLFRPGDDNEKQISFSSAELGCINGIVQSFPVNRNTDGTIADLRSVKQEIADNPVVQIAFSSYELKTENFSNNLKIVFSLESFKGLSEGNLSLLQRYFNEGVREIGIHNSGKDEIYEDNLLTEYGKNFIREVNRLGIICDITHIRSIIRNQIIELSEAPVIISHGGAYGAVESEFNIPDSILTKLVKKGGMVGITFFSGQISNKSLSEINNGVDWKEAARAGIEDLVDHIDYLKRKFGVDNIGIGSDYGGSGQMSPAGLETIEGYPLIVYSLLKRGYSEKEIEKIMGLNFIKYWERVETAKKITGDF